MPVDQPSFQSEELTSARNSELNYLNPIAFHTLGDINGNCPYTNPVFPSIGPDQPIFCPETKKWRHGISWYLSKETYPMIKNNTKDAQNMNDTFNIIHNIQQIMLHFNTNDLMKVNIALHDTSKLHLAYQYISCQNEEEIRKLWHNWQSIIDDEHYMDIFAEYGYTSWNDMEICFDKVLCMNKVTGGAGYNLYLDYNSQRMMKTLIERTERIEENEPYNIKLSFHRNIHQQSFHITIGSVTVIEGDSTLFDYEGLMNQINENLHIPCIKLGGPPRMRETSCYNTKTLTPSNWFKWTCKNII